MNVLRGIFYITGSLFFLAGAAYLLVGFYMSYVLSHFIAL